MDTDIFIAIILIFLCVVLGLALTPTITSYGKAIETDANSSDIMKIIAPYIGVVWLASMLSIAGVIGVAIYKKLTS